MVSNGREQDRQLRQNMLELTQICIKSGRIEDAKFFGAESKRLKKKIETYDYRYEDAQHARVTALDKRWNELTQYPNKS